MFKSKVVICLCFSEYWVRVMWWSTPRFTEVKSVWTIYNLSMISSNLHMSNELNLDKIPYFFYKGTVTHRHSMRLGAGIVRVCETHHMRRLNRSGDDGAPQPQCRASAMTLSHTPSSSVKIMFGYKIYIEPKLMQF